MTLTRLAAKITHKNEHLITLSDRIKALKTGFVENMGQSVPLKVVSKTIGKCQM